MNRRKLLVLLGTACMVLMLVVPGFLAGCAKPAAPTTAEPIKIGVMLPLTGPVASFGEPGTRGFDLKFDEVGWEVAGRPIEAIYADEGFDPAVSLDTARKLVEADKVSIIVGMIMTPAHMAVCPYTASMNVVTLLYASGVPAVTENKLTYMPSGTLYEFAMPVGWYAYDEMGIRTVSVVASDYEGGHVPASGFMDGFKERGGTVVQEQYVPFPTIDFAPFFTAIKPADALLFMVYAAPEVIGGVRQFHELGLANKMKLINPVGGHIDNVILGALKDTGLGMTGGLYWTSDYDTPENKKFMEGYKAKYGKEVSSEIAAFGYDTASELIAALEATGGDTTPEKLDKAIMGLKLKLPSSPLHFEQPNRWAKRGTHVCEVQKVDGKPQWKIVHTYNP